MGHWREVTMTHEEDTDAEASISSQHQQERVGESGDASPKLKNDGWKQLDVTFCADGDAMLVSVVSIQSGRIY